MRSFLVITVSLVFIAYAHGKEPSWRYSATGQADRKQFTSKVTDAALAKAPAWSKGSERPPLSPGRARELAYKQLQESVHDAKQWKLHEIGLVDTGDHVHWIYVAHFMRRYPDTVAVFGAEFFDIVVLMDGTPIKPELIHK